MNKTITVAEWSLLKYNNHSSQSMNFDWEDIIASIDARQYISANTVSLLSNNNTNNRSRGNSYRTDLNNMNPNLLDSNSRFFTYRHRIKIDIREYNHSRNLDLEHLNRNGRNWDVTTTLWHILRKKTYNKSKHSKLQTFAIKTSNHLLPTLYTKQRQYPSIYQTSSCIFCNQSDDIQAHWTTCPDMKDLWISIIQ